MIALRECEARDCVWRAVPVLKDCYICGLRVGQSPASVRLRGAGVLGDSTAALCPLAVPGKARLTLLGQNSVHMGRLRDILPQLLPTLASSRVLPSICSSVSGSHDRSRLVSQDLCLSLHFLPSSLGQELLPNFDVVFSEVGGRLRLVPVTAVHRSQRDWSVFLCLLLEKGHVSPKHWWETKAVWRKYHLFVLLCLVPSLTGYGPKSVINDMCPSCFCF